MRRHSSPLVHLLGVPLDLGGGRRGVDMGPSAVRIAGLGERLAAWACTLSDGATWPRRSPRRGPQRDPKKKYIREIARVCQKLYQQVSSRTPRARCRSCSAAITRSPPDRSARRRTSRRRAGGEIGLLWVDAHGDMNTPATTTSGNVHGMPLAALLGPEPAELSKIGVRSPKVRADKTVLIGIRNLDDLEKEQIRDAKVHVFTMKDIDQHGIAVVMKRALAIAGKDTAGIHVSFDLDVCDPGDRARRRHAGQGRPRLPRSAHGDGDGRRLADG